MLPRPSAPTNSSMVCLHSHGRHGHPRVRVADPWTQSSTHFCWEHPRVRGEDPVGRRLRLIPAGTPPRARGRRVTLVVCGSGVGNTPACAGKTARLSGRARTGGEHPRVRGEDVHNGLDTSDATGTPPRARGRLDEVCGHNDNVRNTPACAGKTTTSKGCDGLTREHPRVRGEDRLVIEWPGDGAGTPPRARGRQRIGQDCLPMAGNTPACAGKTPALEKVLDPH